MLDRARARARRAKKYGQPIYAGAWLDDRTALLAGGGGKKSSGIPNRILIASCERGPHGTTLADAEAWTHTDEDAPQRLAVHPGREHVVCAFGGTLGVFRARRGANDGADEGASSSGTNGEARWTIESCASALGLPNRVHVTPDEREIKCAAFDAEGARLALGLESGEVKILAWPSLEVEKELGAHEKGAVTDIAWAPDGDGLLTTSAENATASNIGRGAAVWSVERGERVLTLFDESIVKKSGGAERGVSRRGVRPRHERVDERGVDWGESRRRRLGGEVGRRHVESHQQGASVQKRAHLRVRGERAGYAHRRRKLRRRSKSRGRAKVYAH